MLTSDAAPVLVSLSAQEAKSVHAGSKRISVAENVGKG
jgi:hypothetical protein